MSDKYLTKEQAAGMIEDVIGSSLEKYHKDWSEKRQEFLKEISYAASHKEPDKPKKMTKEKAGESFANMVHCLAKSGAGNLEGATKIAKDMGDDILAKALGTSTVAGGGVVIEPEYATEMIELLRAQTVVLESGARIVPMDSGILNFGRVGTGVTAAYRGESVDGTVSEPALEELELRARILDVMTPASNQLLRRAGGRGTQFIQEELIAGAKDKMDSTFIRSTGTSNKPKGLLYLAASANKSNESNTAGTTGASTVAEIVYDLGRMMRGLMDGNVRGIRNGWLIAPRTWQRLFTQLDSNSNHVWKDELTNGTIYGIPYKTTTNIPINLTAAAGSGAGSDASEVYLADFFDILMGETEGLIISTSTEASYPVSGSLVSAFSRGETLVKVEMEHDLAARHAGVEIMVLESVTWGTV